jgi:HEPN domain-containing protein
MRLDGGWRRRHPRGRGSCCSARVLVVRLTGGPITTCSSWSPRSRTPLPSRPDFAASLTICEPLSTCLWYLRTSRAVVPRCAELWWSARFVRDASLPTPEQQEVAQLLLEKATGDLTAAQLLAADARQADHVVGFHAQQAVEKSIKAVLAGRGLEIPRTHDLGFLLSLAADDASVPSDVAGAAWLTPWAGGWRYDTEASPIDRALAVATAESAVRWSATLMDGS